MRFHKKWDLYVLNIKIIKSKITRDINKQLLPDVTKFDEISDELKYYKTVRNVNFMIFKNLNLIIFQSPILSKILFMKYNENIFYLQKAEGTFYIAPKFISSVHH